LEQLKRVHDTIITQILQPSPLGGDYKHFYKTIDPVTSFGPYTNDEVQAAIDSSAILISYLGHSGTQTWDNGIVDPGQLQSTSGSAPLITDFGCSTGKFAEPDIVSFSELFTVGTKGEAIAYIGNSSLGFISTSTLFPSIFYNRLLLDQENTISENLKLAKIEMLQRYGFNGVYKLFSLTNTLLGDPIISLPVPDKPNLTVSAFTINEDTASDNFDHLNIKFNFNNYGKVTADYFQIKVMDEWDSIINLDTLFSLQLPLLKGEITLDVPIYQKAGKHSLKFLIDEQNTIDEYNENDNTMQIIYNVKSSAVRLMADYLYENEADDTVIILNPQSYNKGDSIKIDISQTPDFINNESKTFSQGSFYNSVALNESYSNKRIWMRGKLQNSDEYCFNNSLYISNKTGYLVNDIYGLENLKLEHLTLSDNRIIPDTPVSLFKVISAGFHDGKTAVISKDEENYVPMGNIIGHHVCVFNAQTSEFKGYKKFNVLGSDAQTIKDYYNFLDSLNEDYFVMIAISDEGCITVDSLREKIKEFGSLYIDSLSFRSSWAFIGRKGLPPGSALESFSKAYTGRVQIDTAVECSTRKGYFTTPLIGPAAEWGSISLQKNIPPATDLKVRLLGMNHNGDFDSLNYFNNDSCITIADDLPYRYIKLNGIMTSESTSSPELSGIRVAYTYPAELGISASEVLVSDTIQHGEAIDLSFFVGNAGGIAADSFKVNVELKDENNKSNIIHSVLIDKLNVKEKTKVSCSYISETNGGKEIFISIDPQNSIFEKHEDNNYLTLPIYISPDTSLPKLKITFDGNEIVSGEYVSATPEINIGLYDTSPLPISDPANLIIYFDDQLLNYTINSDSLFYETGNEQKIRVTYKPRLSEGEHKLKIIAMDASGNYCDSTRTEILFYSDDDLKLLNVYNYPNPFSAGTNFTFNITQIPDEFRLNIYTLTGRLIKTILLAKSDLNHGFNSINWDGTDEDGDLVGNGIYFYKISIIKDGKSQSVIQKMAKVM
jgi:hypothetical protein